MRTRSNKSMMMKCGVVMLSAFILAVVWRCSDEYIELSTTDDVNITAYFENNPEQYSEFLKLLEITGNKGFLGAYGAYTCFAPTNDAFKQFLQDKGAGSLEEIEEAELKEIVRFHIIQDTISTKSFTDGKLPKPTMQGQYLITGADFLEGATKVTVNRQAGVVEGNIETGNGIIHAIDHVLQYAKLPVGEMVAQMEGHTIFIEALKETKLYDTLNQVSDAHAEDKRWFTVITQSDEVFHNAGFSNYADLKAEFSDTGDPSNPEDSLYLFMAYHCLGGLKYLADIVVSSSHSTLAPREVITTKLAGDTLLINEEVFNGVLEKGVAFNRAVSDNSAVNGVVHTVKGHYFIKVRLPMPVYFDVGEQPELVKNAAVFRVPGQSLNLSEVYPEGITWEGGNPIYADVNYFCTGPTSSDPYVYGDGIYVYLRTAVIKSIEFTTPLIVKGKYKVWVGVRRSNGGIYQGFLDGEALPRTFNGSDYYPSSLTEGEAEAQGYKWYTVDQRNTVYARLLGTVDIETTDRHKIKFVALDNKRGGVSFDMIQFIPADIDQQWPRFNRDGTMQN